MHSLYDPFHFFLHYQAFFWQQKCQTSIEPPPVSGTWQNLRNENLTCFHLESHRKILEWTSPSLGQSDAPTCLPLTIVHTCEHSHEKPFKELQNVCLLMRRRDDRCSLRRCWLAGWPTIRQHCWCF